MPKLLNLQELSVMHAYDMLIHICMCDTEWKWIYMDRWIYSCNGKILGDTVVDHSGSLPCSRACKSQDIQVSPHWTTKCSGLLTPHPLGVRHNYEFHYYCLRPFRRFRMVITSSSRSTSTSAKRRLMEEYRSRISRNSPSSCLTRFRSPTRSLTTVSTSPKFWSATAWTFCCSANALIPGQKTHNNPSALHTTQQ
jgi:hypothetical protein